MTDPTQGTPAADGFRMPGEWHPHRRCWIGWPTRASCWRRHRAAACDAVARVARAIAAFEPVALVCRPEDAATAARLTDGAVELVTAPIDDSWLRDTGPSFLVDGRGGLAATDWLFNAWGRKVEPYDEDAAFAAWLAARVGARRYAAPIVNEGGAIHVDGEGTVLTTEDVLLNPNRAGPDGRTPERGAVERALCDYLGAERVVWLKHGLVSDTDTDGHVDTVAAFVRPGIVLAQASREPADPNHDRLADNLARLRAARDARGRALQIIEIVEPAAQEEDGQRLSLSYVNFYLANGGLVAPTFGVPEDEAALATLVRAFPDRRVVGVPARAIFVGGGGIHCITQQEPLP